MPDWSEELIAVYNALEQTLRACLGARFKNKWIEAKCLKTLFLPSRSLSGCSET
jgi:hypothetical protein